MIKDYQKKDIKKSPKTKATVKQEFDDGIMWAKAIKGVQNFGFFWKGKEILNPSKEAAEVALKKLSEQAKEEESKEYDHQVAIDAD